jgi:hypothetical protein
MIGTFVAVLMSTMLKEAFEDFQRFRADRELNNKKTQLFVEFQNQCKEILWEDVKVPLFTLFTLFYRLATF